MTDFSKEALKSALIELARSDRAFFASLIADLMRGEEPAKILVSGGSQKTATQRISGVTPPAKIIPHYRKNAKKLRQQYAMDKTVLAKLQDLFADGPPAEAFLQTNK